jgi:hypothetical protein
MTDSARFGEDSQAIFQRRADIVNGMIATGNACSYDNIRCFLPIRMKMQISLGDRWIPVYSALALASSRLHCWSLSRLARSSSNSCLISCGVSLLVTSALSTHVVIYFQKEFS